MNDAQPAKPEPYCHLCKAACRVPFHQIFPVTLLSDHLLLNPQQQMDLEQFGAVKTLDPK